MKEEIISVKGLEHSYGNTKAVRGISFKVYRGEIFSFLGPNGAGKSTTINILTTLLPLQKGEVYVSGYDVSKNKKKVRESIGIVFQDEVLDRDLTVWETLEFHGRIYSMQKKKRRERIEEMLELAELKNKRNERVKNLSGGMKRRLEIARGLMTRPEILFLDEPTLGLDPQTRMRIWDYVKMVNREGITIFLTTHYMDEADMLSTRIHIIDHGKIIASGTSEELKNSIGRDIIYLTTNKIKEVKEILTVYDGIKEIKPSIRGLELTINIDGRKLLPKIIVSLEKKGIEIEGINLKKPTLDDVFVHYTGREMRDEKADRRREMTLRRRRK